MTTLPSTIAGYPRIGRRRELKKAVEALWSGAINEQTYRELVNTLLEATTQRLTELGLATPYAIPDSFSAYDQVLDITTLLGAIPGRFASKTGLDLYFSLARGDDDHPPLEMTKWFDTNYHYLVPEIGPDTPISLADTSVISRALFLKDKGYTVRPVLVGPVTYLALAKSAAGDDWSPLERLDDVVGVYEQLLHQLTEAGIEWVQFDEPALVTDNLSISRADLTDKAVGAWSRLAGLTSRPQIFLNLPYGDSSLAAPKLAATGVDAIGIDLIRGSLPATTFTQTLVAGVIDGRNIWRNDLDRSLELLREAQKIAPKVVVGTSNSLQHVPHDTGDENWEGELGDGLRRWLAFADQKVAEVAILDRYLAGDDISTELEECRAALEHRASFPGVSVPEIRNRVAALTPEDRSREDYAERVAAQESLGLPPLPTTTIGSFPQTSEIRSVRSQHAKAAIGDDEYEKRIKQEIASVIALQEDIGLDVLVHGEAERNDMVQYFCELLGGCAFTTHGWVQSYGSRCTRPSILWGDISHTQDLSTAWWQYAQSLTDKPVKGMLTGPVTIIAWSFPRNDIPLSEVADQLALALRDEIASLEDAGARVIQVDEPALRELLPLDEDRHQAYLDWSVGAFRAATCGVKPETQIHTHLCYSEFGQIIAAIADLDADVTSIEAARSRMEVLPDLAEHGFDHGVGPGVWDIHSPRVPSVDELTELLTLATASIDPAKLWVNPDCGLKTRAYPETEATLRNLVEATQRVRS